jgi:hypothetical protein
MDGKTLRNYIDEHIVRDNKIFIKGKTLNKHMKIIETSLLLLQKEGHSLQEKLYLFYHEKTIPLCPNCGKKNRFRRFVDPYSEFCSVKCSRKKMVETLTKTNMKRYGVAHTFQRKDVRKKIEFSNMERYSATNPFQSKAIIKKIRNSHIERYGFINTNRGKAAETCLLRYGVDNPAKDKGVQKKMVQTNLKRYGVRSVLCNKEEYLLVKYGVDNVFRLDWVKEKIMKKRIANGTLGKNKKWIIYNGHKLQSRFELKIATILDERGFLWESHGKYLYYMDDQGIRRKYCVDFYLPFFDFYLEPHCAYYWNEKFINKIKNLRTQGYKILEFKEDEIDRLVRLLDTFDKSQPQHRVPKKTSSEE